MSQPSLAQTFTNGLLGLTGRMTRSDFWVTTIALAMAAGLVSVALPSAIGLVMPTAPIWFLPLIIQLLVAWPGYAISVKRGHDRERSALWTLWVNIAFHVVPLTLIVLHQRQGALWVYLVIGVYVFFDYGVLDGTQGTNKYGPSPKGAIRV